MECKKERSINVTQKYAEGTQKSYETAWERFALAQEACGSSEQDLLEDTGAFLGDQSERNLDASDELVRQVRERQEASRALAQGSARAYVQFLDSLFLYYRESVRLSEGGATERRQVAESAPELLRELRYVARCSAARELRMLHEPLQAK